MKKEFEPLKSKTKTILINDVIQTALWRVRQKVALLWTVCVRSNDLPCMLCVYVCFFASSVSFYPAPAVLRFPLSLSLCTTFAADDFLLHNFFPSLLCAYSIGFDRHCQIFTIHWLLITQILWKNKRATKPTIKKIPPAMRSMFEYIFAFHHT